MSDRVRSRSDVAAAVFRVERASSNDPPVAIVERHDSATHAPRLSLTPFATPPPMLPAHTPRPGGAQSLRFASNAELDALRDNERRYVEDTAYVGLRDRYLASSSSARAMLTETNAYARELGAFSGTVEGVVDVASLRRIRDLAFADLRSLFDNSRAGVVHREKLVMMRDELRTFLKLVARSQAQRDLGVDVSASSLLGLVRSNIALLAFQDRVARENMLGDHGVRHLAYDIRQADAIFDALEARGQTVKPIDRLVMHQAVILHDAGYAMSVVRNAVNAGNTDAQEGHNVLAAKHVRERMADVDDPLCSVFSRRDLERIHEAALHHDSADISFVVGDASDAARDRNLFCAIRLADGTHAFESKLPELLLAHPETLRTMRVLATAWEIGADDLVVSLKRDLKDEIGRAGFAKSDALVLRDAVDRIEPRNVRKSIDRIFGVDPHIDIDERGRATVTVRESLIHDEVSNVFGVKPHARAKKLAADLLGLDKQQRKDIDVATGVVEHAHVAVRFRTGAAKRKKTDSAFEAAVAEIVREPAFNRFAVRDTRWSLLHKIATRALDDASEPAVARAVAKLGLEKEARSSSPKRVLLEFVERMRAKRMKLVTRFLDEHRRQ